jgi:vacuolar-type H+-ATPase subunit E/Vma4
VVITSSDGKVKADATIESLMDSNLDAIRRILSKELGK